MNRAEERRNAILEMLQREHNELPVSAILAQMDVSDETIRKDLMLLEDRGYIMRKHGKILLAESFSNAPAPMRAEENIRIKEALAEEVVRNLKLDRNILIGMDVGSTVWNVAKLLVDNRDPVIITNSLDIANLYSDKNNTNIYCAGGTLVVHDRGFYGHWTCQNLGDIRTSAVILGTPGLRGLGGLGAISFEDRDVKRLMIANSDFSIAVFDNSKFSRRALVDAAPWSEIDLVVTDDGAPQEELDLISSQTKLIVVSVD